jgi:hypothetical protein
LPNPPAVVGDDPVTGGEQDVLLLLPRRPVEGIAVDQDHGLPRAVVVVVELDDSGVLSPDTDSGH